MLALDYKKQNKQKTSWLVLNGIHSKGVEPGRREGINAMRLTLSMA